MPPPLTVLIPVNRLERAKGRLAELLRPEERAEVVRRSLASVLRAVSEAALEPVVLTSDEPACANLPEGVRTLAESPERHGLSAQLEDATERLGGTELLILHADLPLASAEALLALAKAAPEAPSATLVRSRDGGTNAMLLRPPGRFALAYGSGSGDLHEAAARAAGLAVLRTDVPALALDLDTPADVRRLLATPEGRASEAGRYLAALGVEERAAFGAAPS